MEQSPPNYFQIILKKHLLLILGTITFIYSLCMPDRQLLWQNYRILLRSETHLLQDTFALAGPAASFFNIATHFWLMYALVRWNKQTAFGGLQFAALGLFIGHSFFGSHLLNVLPIIIGVYLYSWWTHQSFKRYTTVSIFSTATAPLVSFVANASHLAPFHLFLSVSIGILCGFIAPVLAEQFIKFHQGFSLYNFGFTSGIIAMFISLLFPYFDLNVESRVVTSNTYHHVLIGYIFILLVICCLVWLPHFPNRQELKRLYHSSGRIPDDFVSKFSASTVAFNFFINGSVYLILLLLLGVTFSGPVVGGICAIMGFSAFGKHLRNILPISFGVLIGAWLLNVEITHISVILPMLLGTSLAPIAGYYGAFFGILAGFLHYNLTSVVLPLHYGMTLYNNGFSCGFIAAFLVPVIDTILEHQPDNY